MCKDMSITPLTIHLIQCTDMLLLLTLGACVMDTVVVLCASDIYTFVSLKYGLKMFLTAFETHTLR